jgi:hypothetical protein
MDRFPKFAKDFEPNIGKHIKNIKEYRAPAAPKTTIWQPIPGYP